MKRGPYTAQPNRRGWGEIEGRRERQASKEIPFYNPDSVQEDPWKQVLIKCSGLLQQNASLIPTS